MDALNKKTKDRIFIVLMLAIPVTHFLVFWLYLNFSSIAIAFQDEYTTEFSLANFDRFFKSWKRDFSNDGPLKYALINTLIEITIGNFVNMPLVIFASFILFKKFYGHTYFRVVFYIPAIVGAVIITMMQTYVLDATGPIVQIGKALSVDWNFEILQSGLLGNYVSARPTYFITRVGISGATVLLITGALNRIPQDLFDSGKLDGIGLFREFFYLALPLSWSTVGIMWVMSFAGGWAAYNDVMLLTGGSYNTTNLGYFLVSHTLSATSGSGENFNYPAAIGLLMTGVIAPLTLVLRCLAEKLVSPVDF